MLLLTGGAEGKRRRSRARSNWCSGLSAAARGSTPPVAVARGADAPPLFSACRRPSLQFQIVLGLIFVILKLFNVFFFV